MIAQHLPVLPVVLPLMSAPLAVLLRRPLAAWSLALAVSWACFAMALALLFRVLDEGTISYAIGDWAAPWGIEYRVDRAGALVLVIVSAIAALVMPSPASASRRRSRPSASTCSTPCSCCP